MSSENWCWLCQEDASTCRCNIPIDQEHSYAALKAIHSAFGHCGNSHREVYSYRSCVIAEIPRLKKQLMKAKQAAEQQGRGVAKLRKKLDALMHAKQENETQPAAILAFKS